MAQKVGLAMRVTRAWNAFRNKDPAAFPKEEGIDPVTYSPTGSVGIMTSVPQTPRRFLRAGADRTIIASIYDRIATDCSRVSVRHVRVDQNDGYVETINDGLNDIFTLEANVDQTGREFLTDVVMTMLDGNGVAACVPVDVTSRPESPGSFDILTMRVGKVTDWLPRSVKVELYNDMTGNVEQLWLPKGYVGIVVNPFRSVMNEPNSTLAHLTDKLAQIDSINDQISSGKIDLLIQLPYVTKSKTRQEEAEKRVGQIYDQLKDSEYGIAYIDGTEKVIQLNRSLENNILSQVEFLTKQLYSQLGLTQEIMDGTASESAMNNYYNRTINPILDAICDEFERKFLTKTARSQGQAVRYYRDPFGLTTSEQIAEIADKFTRNAILSSNEMRAVIGFKPVDDERANELRNKNLNATDKELETPILATDGDGEKAEEPKGELGNQNERTML